MRRPIMERFFCISLNQRKNVILPDMFHSSCVQEWHAEANDDMDFSLGWTELPFEMALSHDRH